MQGESTQEIFKIFTIDHGHASEQARNSAQFRAADPAFPDPALAPVRCEDKGTTGSEVSPPTLVLHVPRVKADGSVLVGRDGVLGGDGSRLVRSGGGQMGRIQVQSAQQLGIRPETERSLRVRARRPRRGTEMTL